MSMSKKVLVNVLGESLVRVACFCLTIGANRFVAVSIFRVFEKAAGYEKEGKENGGKEEK